MRNGEKDNQLADRIGSHPLRVLFLVDRMGYPDGTTHGGTTYFLSTLPALHRSGIELTVCFMGPPHPAADQLEAEGVTPIFLNRRKWSPLAFFDVLHMVDVGRIDVLHLASLKSLLFGRWAAALLGRQAIAHIHDMTPLPPVLRTLQRLTGPLTSAGLVLSSAMREFALREFRLPPQSLQVLHNGMDIEPFCRPGRSARQRLRRMWNVSGKSPLVVVPGRFVPEKGQHLFILALPKLFKRIPDASICFVGDGTTRRECEAMVQQMRFSDRVRFAGYRDDMPDVMAAADAVVVPSVEEPFGYVALEAMAAAKPVVAFDSGGLPEVIVHGSSGLLVPRANTHALGDAVIRILTDPHLAGRLGEAAQRRARQFTIEAHVSRLVNLYENVAGRHHAEVPPTMNGKREPVVARTELVAAK